MCVGQGLSSRLVKKVYSELHCNQHTVGYGINMDPGEGTNWLAKKLTRMAASLFGVEHGPTLRLYSLDACAMVLFAETLRAHRGDISYLSTSGVKDLTVQ